MILPDMTDAEKAKHWLEVMTEIAEVAKREKDKGNEHIGSWLIGRYHDALGELAQASGENLGYYTIRMGRLEPVGRTKDVQCDADYFRSQITDLLKHFKTRSIPK